MALPHGLITEYWIFSKQKYQTKLYEILSRIDSFEDEIFWWTIPKWNIISFDIIDSKIFNVNYKKAENETYRFR